MQPDKDRRRQKRFKPKDATLVLIEYDSSGELGDLIDISKDGLAYKRYESREVTNEAVDLDVFLSDNSFCIKKVPYNLISDIKIDNELPLHFIDLVKRRGVQFGLLTDQQISALEYFIGNHTKTEEQQV